MENRRRRYLSYVYSVCEAFLCCFSCFSRHLIYQYGNSIRKKKVFLVLRVCTTVFVRTRNWLYISILGAECECHRIRFVASSPKHDGVVTVCSWDEFSTIPEIGYRWRKSHFYYFTFAVSTTSRTCICIEMKGRRCNAIKHQPEVVYVFLRIGMEPMAINALVCMLVYLVDGRIEIFNTSNDLNQR